MCVNGVLKDMEYLARAAIESALKAGVRFADIRIESTTSTVIEVSDGVTRRCVAARLRGAGIRAFIDGAWAFAQTSDLTTGGMRDVGESVARLALATRSRVAHKFDIDGPTYHDHVEMDVKVPLDQVPIDEKMILSKTIDEQMRQFDKRIINTRTIYSDTTTELFIANSLGTEIHMKTFLPRLSAVSTSKDGASRQRAFKSFGMRGGFEVMKSETVQNLGTNASELAIQLLSSVAVKGGNYDVVMNPVLNGVMVHEAFGHACEADNWPAHTTVLEDKVGKSVGPEELNLSDDPTLASLRGSFEYDWEGTKTKKRHLVKNGILTELLHSLETSSRLGMIANGAARAQSFMSPPIPRMSNTFMEPGDWEVDEIIEDTQHGLLLCDFNYGYTDPSKGQFMFQANYGYFIENGVLGQMVRDVSLAGQILDVLAKVDAIAKDFVMEPGTCGKAGQQVPDTSGGPHARIRDIPVGGM